MDRGRGSSMGEQVRWGLSGPRKCRYAQTLWFGDHGGPSISGGRGKVKHLQIAITCVARAMCGVTETDCSCTANISTPSMEQGSSVLNQVMSLAIDVSGRHSRLLLEALRSDSGLWTHNMPVGRRSNSDSGEIQAHFL